MGEVEFKKEDEYKVKIMDGGDYKEPGGGVRKPTQEEIDEYKIHRIVVMVIFGLVVAVLLLLIVILIATTDDCKVVKEEQLPWYKSGVIYNIYPRSFKDESGDGVGDFKGIIQKLDYLKNLGVNILYLSSVFKIDPDFDYGYSVVDFYQTNPQYGNLKDFEKLVDGAHSKGMKVIIELVATSTSIEHKWFDESSSKKGKEDWYVWTENNSTNSTGGWSKSNGRYYLHEKDSNKTAYLNWNSEPVQDEFQNILKFWLDKKVDGFRAVSVQKLFGDKPTGNEWTKIHAIVQQWKNYTTMKWPNSIMIGSSHPANQHLYDLYGTKNKTGLDIVLNFELVHDSHDGSNSDFYTAENFKKIITDYIRKLSKDNWPSWVLTSWVHGRVGSNVDHKLARSLQALLLTLPGTPVVFYGDEIGMRNVNNSGNPPEDVNKAPMQWNKDKNAGFSNKTTWFGDVGNSSYTNAKDDQLGIKKKFTELLKLRMENASVLLDGPLANFTVIDSGSVLAYTFTDKVPRFAVAINFGNAEGKINLNEMNVKSGKLKYHTDDRKPGEISMNALKVPAKVLYLFEVTKE